MILKTFKQVEDEVNSTQDYVINVLYVHNRDFKMTSRLREVFVILFMVHFST